MNRYVCAAVTLGLVSVAIPLRAASRPHAGTDRQNTLVWTNDDLKSLPDLGLNCIVSRMDEETSTPASPTQPYAKAQDPEWYAEQAARLRDQLVLRKAQLDGYREAIDEATSLKTVTGGINFDESNMGITPEAGMATLRQRVSEAESQLDALEDQARRNGIEPGVLRSHRAI